MKFAATLLLIATPAFAHRLDEYLQGTLLSVEKNRVKAEITLVPGVAVFHTLMATVDANSDGIISDAEQQKYANRILHDVSLAIDGHFLPTRLLAVQFPAIAEMKEGSGEIRVELEATLPSGGRTRKLTFENRHLSGMAAYQVNSLVPSDPDIKITAQRRNYTQSTYEMNFVQTSNSCPPTLLTASAILLIACRTLLRRKQHPSPCH